MLGRSSEVRKTPLGQSLAELGGREMTRYLWKELERLGATATLGSRAERLLAGWSGDGYTAVWALTISELVALTEQSGASRVIPLADIEGVVRPADGTLRVLVGGARFVTFRSPDAGIDAFARAVADRAHVPLGGVDALFSADGLVVLAGTPSRVTGYYLGGFRDLPAGPVAVMSTTPVCTSSRSRRHGGRRLRSRGRMSARSGSRATRRPASASPLPAF